MNKETKEIFVAAAVVYKSAKAASEDGKIDFTDIGHFFDDIPHIQAAIEDAGKVPSEVANMSNEDKEEIFEAVENELGEALSDEDRSDIIDIAQGLFSTYRIIRRKKPDTPKV